MKFAVSSKGDQVSDTLKSKIQAYLLDFDMELDENEPEIVISVGGDGTLLYAFHRYSDRLDKTAFVGVHTGHLGFMPTGFLMKLKNLFLPSRKRRIIQSNIRFEVIVTYHENEREERYLALNECTIKSIEGSLVADVEIKGSSLKPSGATVLCLSTPSGSTAYNKALGGAIIHPSIRAIQLAEMASINNRVFRTVGSPLLLPSHHDCMIKPKRS